MGASSSTAVWPFENRCAYGGEGGQPTGGNADGGASANALPPSDRLSPKRTRLRKPVRGTRIRAAAIAKTAESDPSHGASSSTHVASSLCARADRACKRGPASSPPVDRFSAPRWAGLGSITSVTRALRKRPTSAPVPDRALSVISPSCTGTTARKRIVFTASRRSSRNASGTCCGGSRMAPHSRVLGASACGGSPFVTVCPSPSHVSYLCGSRASVFSCRTGQYQFSSRNAPSPIAQRSGSVATSSICRGASSSAGTFIGRSLMPEVTSR